MKKQQIEISQQEQKVKNRTKLILITAFSSLATFFGSIATNCFINKEFFGVKFEEDSFIVGIFLSTMSSMCAGIVVALIILGKKKKDTSAIKLVASGKKFSLCRLLKEESLYAIFMSSKEKKGLGTEDCLSLEEVANFCKGNRKLLIGRITHFLVREDMFVTVIIVRYPKKATRPRFTSFRLGAGSNLRLQYSPQKQFFMKNA